MRAQMTSADPLVSTNCFVDVFVLRTICIDFFLALLTNLIHLRICT